MVPIQMMDSGPSITERDIERVEQEFCIQFPADYRSFLLKHNGGRPDPSVFPIPDDLMPDQSSILDWFYGIDPTDEYNDIPRNINVFRDRIPADCVPIGCDPGGNQICLVVSGDEVGQLYFWDHEMEADEGEAPSYDNMALIAESIGDLLDKLGPLPDL